MKRYGKTEHLWERICAEETVEKAMRQSLIKHKYPGMKTADYNAAQKYMIAHWDECKQNVLRTLTSETYVFHRLHSFKVYEPKERVIHCPQQFPDKIIMICVYIVLRDYFYSKFVRNTYNCIKGRGIHDAKAAIERIMRKHYNWYYVQTDIQKFYPTLRHDIIKADLRKVFKDVKVLKLLDAIVDVYHEGVDEEGNEIGIAIGINLSQLMAILVNMPVLREINERWHYPSVNFTDDCFTAVPNKAAAHEFLNWYIERSKQRGMKVKANARIAPMTEPVRMIGYEFHVTADGQQYTLLSKPIKLRMKRRVRQLAKRNITDEEWKQQMASYYGWCKHARCTNLMQKTYGDRYKLFEDMRTLQEVKENIQGPFGLPKSRRESVVSLLGVDICFYDVTMTNVQKIDPVTHEETYEERCAIKFRHAENNEPIGDEAYFVTGSESLRSRAERYKDQMPFIGKVVKKSGRNTQYYVIE